MRRRTAADARPWQDMSAKGHEVLLDPSGPFHRPAPAPAPAPAPWMDHLPDPTRRRRAHRRRRRRHILLLAGTGMTRRPCRKQRTNAYIADRQTTRLTNQHDTHTHARTHARAYFAWWPQSAAAEAAGTGRRRRRAWTREARRRERATGAPARGREETREGGVGNKL